MLSQYGSLAGSKVGKQLTNAGDPLGGVDHQHGIVADFPHLSSIAQQQLSRLESCVIMGQRRRQLNGIGDKVRVVRTDLIDGKHNQAAAGLSVAVACRGQGG